MPKGMLEREKWLSAGIESQDLSGAIVKGLDGGMRCSLFG